MTGHKRSLYVACALQGAPQEYIDGVASIKQMLRDEHGINVLDFLGLGDFTPLEVYEWDIERCVKKCDAFLGIYGQFSDGRGYETSEAMRRSIPKLGVALRGQTVSKVITGAYEYHQQPFFYVDNLQDEVPPLVLKHFLELAKVL